MNIKASNFYKVTKENQLQEEKDFIKTMNEYMEHCEKNNVEPKIEKIEKMDEAYYALHDYIDWFNHRKDNILTQ
jgi:uncharacterized membrane protein (DUF106 family)